MAKEKGDNGFDKVMHEAEQRITCKTCVSHLQHKEQIANLEIQIGKEENIMSEMWTDIKKKVPWGVFLAIMTGTVTLIVAVSSINFAMMVKVLGVSQSTQLSMVAIQKDVEGLGKRMELYEKWIDKINNEHEDMDDRVDELEK